MEKLLRFLKYITFFCGFYALLVCAFMDSQAFAFEEGSLLNLSALVDKKEFLVFLAITLLIVNCLLALLIKFKYDFVTRRQIIISVVARAVAFILSYVTLRNVLDRLVEQSQSVGRYAYFFIVVFGGVFIFAFSFVVWILKKSARSCCPEYTSADSSSSYSLAANGADRGEKTIGAQPELSPSGKRIIKRFSKNAYIEKELVYELYVNCFYDNHGIFHTVDEVGWHVSRLEQFGRENEIRFYGTDTYNPVKGETVDAQGNWWYIKSGDLFYDSRKNRCVMRGRF